MDASWKRRQAIRELCDLIKKCMRDADRLAAGGRDIPSLVAEFQRDITKLRQELSSGEMAEAIDAELGRLSPDVILDLDAIGRDELKELIASEFRTCSSYNLERFVSVRSILRALIRAGSERDADDQVRTSKDLSEIVGKNAHAYQAQLLSVRTEHSEGGRDAVPLREDGKGRKMIVLPKEESTEIASRPETRPARIVRRGTFLSRRLEKKKAKRNIYAGIYNTLAGVAFISCNTMTMQMKASASFASNHFKAAKRDLFEK